MIDKRIMKMISKEQENKEKIVTNYFDITDYLPLIIILLIFLVCFITAFFDDPIGIITKIILIKNSIKDFFYP